MKLTFYTNACCEYEADGFRLLCDPWLTEGAFGSWVHDPPLITKIADVLDADAIYISHIHPDHLDEGTLKHFRRDIPILTLKDKLSLAEKKLIELGFNDIIASVNGETMIFKSALKSYHVEATIFGPFTKHPFHGCEIGNIVDSALLIRCNGVSILNTNDNTMSLEAAEAFVRDYGRPTIAQLNFNNAGCYPACFESLTPDDRINEANRCIERNLAHMNEVAKVLGAKYTMPFAGAYKLGFGFEHLNPYLGTCSTKEACAYLEANGISALYLGEGDSIEFL